MLEAFPAERAVVTTAKGAEGLEVRDGEHVRLAEDADAMAEVVTLLHDDQEARARQTAAALALVRRSYSYEAVGEVTRARLREAAGGVS